MKRKILFRILGAVLFVAASVHVGMSVRANNVDRDVLLANVEALSDTEVIGHVGDEEITLTTIESGGEIISAFMFPMRSDQEGGCYYSPGYSCFLELPSGGSLTWDTIASIAVDVLLFFLKHFFL